MFAPMRIILNQKLTVMIILLHMICNFIIDWLKTSAPFWKSEEFENGKKWVDERKEDHIALKRWKV